MHLHAAWYDSNVFSVEKLNYRRSLKWIVAGDTNYTSLWELHATECKLHDRILALDCLAIFAVLCFRVRQNVVLAKQGKWKASRKTCTNATCEVDVVKNKRQIQTWDLW